jgi:hypothetical protein
VIILPKSAKWKGRIIKMKTKSENNRNEAHLVGKITNLNKVWASS